STEGSVRAGLQGGERPRQEAILAARVPSLPLRLEVPDLPGHDRADLLIVRGPVGGDGGRGTGHGGRETGDGGRGTGDLGTGSRSSVPGPRPPAPHPFPLMPVPAGGPKAPPRVRL